MKKHSLGFEIFLYTLAGQIIIILLATLSVAISNTPCKGTILFTTGSSIVYWSLFGSLSYMLKDYYRKEDETI